MTRYLLFIILFYFTCIAARSQVVIRLGLKLPPRLEAGVLGNITIDTSRSVFIGGKPTAYGGTAPYIYSWSPSYGLSSNRIANPLANPDITTTYTLKLTDINSCTSTKSMIVTVDSLAYDISGKVLYDNSQLSPVNSSTVYLVNKENVTVDSAYTDVSGAFRLNSEARGKYTMTCKTAKAWGGSNSTDALLVLKYVVGLYKFPDELKKKAADVNADGKYNSTDALMMGKRFVSLITKFTSVDWLFASDTITVDSSDVTHDLLAICAGDVNASYVPSPAVSFKCGDLLFDSRDNKAYKTVLIGSQCWMAQNLNTDKYLNGEQIPYVSDYLAWNALLTGAYCDYNNDHNIAITYGHLYNWYAATDSRGLCPSGWHLPSDAEWTTLSGMYGGAGSASVALKEAGTTHWKSTTSAVTNISGFTALPGGYRYGTSAVNFSSLYARGSWWSSTEYDSKNVYYRYMVDYNTAVSRLYLWKTYGYSVRCIKD